MRKRWLTLIGVLLTGPALQAQEAPQTPPAADAAQKRLDELLDQWEARMKSVDTLSAQLSREREDKVWRTREVFEGTAKYMKPNLALLDLHQKDKPTRMERYVCTGAYLYEYNQLQRELRYHELPPTKPGQVADDNFLSFLFGMKAQEAKRRYDLKLAGEDAFYVYLEVLPRFPADKADFQKAQLALTKSTMLPRMLTFDEPNGNRITWNVPLIETGARLDRTEFTTPPLPAGWKLVRGARASDAAAPASPGQLTLPPRVIRPNQ
jgi:TIGR03009 family protein